MCLFELIYFARPDSVIHNQRLHLVRQRMGAVLAREAPVDADIVVGLPDSATPAAIGYAQESGIPVHRSADQKSLYRSNLHSARSAITRYRCVAEVQCAARGACEGKRVVLIDDTIVRGTTSRPIVQLLRNAGATEVHMRVHAPPMMSPCYLGVDLRQKR